MHPPSSSASRQPRAASLSPAASRQPPAASLSPAASRQPPAASLSPAASRQPPAASLAGRQPPAASLSSVTSRAFTFRLEPLLKLRRTEEERARAAFLEALGRFRRKEAEIQDLSRRREEAKALGREKETGSVDVEELLRARRFLNVLYQRIAERREELDGCRRGLEDLRSAHRRAAVRLRIVEKLRERRWREFLREEERRERRDLDEIGQLSFVRSRPDLRPAAREGKGRP